MPQQPTQFDVVIIGSGAGGAPVAHTLVAPARPVLVLEKGPLFRPQDDDPMRAERLQARRAVRRPARRSSSRMPGVANTGASFYSSHVEPDLNDEPHVYRERRQRRLRDHRGLHRQVRRRRHAALRRRVAALQPARLPARDVQRGTHRPAQRSERRRRARGARLADQLRRPRAVLQQGRAAGRHQRHARQPDQAAQRGDHYQTPLPPNPISRVRRASAWTALGMKPYRTPLAVITEDHAPSGRTVGPLGSRMDGGPKTAYVNRYGDPLGLKSNTWVSLLAADLRPTAELRAAAELHRHAPRVSDGARVTRVHYRDPAAGRARCRRQGRGRGVLGDRVGAAADALGGGEPRLRPADQPERSARQVLPHPLLRRRAARHAGPLRQVAAARQRLGDRLLRAAEDFIRRTGCGPAARSTTTPPTRRCRSRSAARTAARTSTRSGTRSSTTPA